MITVLEMIVGSIAAYMFLRGKGKKGCGCDD